MSPEEQLRLDTSSVIGEERGKLGTAGGRREDWLIWTLEAIELSVEPD